MLQLLTVQAGRSTSATSTRPSAADGNAFSEQVEERAKAEGAGRVVISAKIESEIAVPADRRSAPSSWRTRASTSPASTG